jgi:hypothetical protein
MRLNPGEAWTRCQRGSITIDYGKFVIENELRSFSK